MNSRLKMKNAKSFLCLSFAALICASVSMVNAQNDGSQQNQTGKAGTFAIIGARIVPVSGPAIEVGTVVIKDGKIAAVGAGVAVPAGAERIDGKGLTVFPGMIDASTEIGLDEIALGVPGSMDVQEVGDFNPNAKAIKGVNPHSTHVNTTRTNGITTVLTHGEGGVISGQAALINLNGSTEDEMALVPTVGLLLNFPRVAGAGRGGGRFGGPQVDFNQLITRRDQQLDELKKRFKETENYARSREAYAADKSLPFVAENSKFEAMIPYIRGQKPILFTAERAIDIKAVTKFVTDMKVKGIILGGQEAWKVADDLKKSGISVIYTNVYDVPVRDDDAYDTMFEAPSKMAAAGVKFCIATGASGEDISVARDLPFQAGMAGAYGLSKEDALKSVTLYPAQILGVANRVGSIEVGKDANVVVTDGDILEPRTNVKYVFINGRMLPLTSRHTELFNSFKDRK